MGIELYCVPEAERADTTQAILISTTEVEVAEVSKAIGISTTGLKTSATIPVRGRIQPANALPQSVAAMDARGTLSILRASGIALGSSSETVFESVPAAAEAKHRHALEVGLAVSPISGSFFRSKVVSLTPRLVLVNKTGFIIEYTQVSGWGRLSFFASSTSLPSV